MPAAGGASIRRARCRTLLHPDFEAFGADPDVRLTSAMENLCELQGDRGPNRLRVRGSRRYRELYDFGAEEFAVSRISDGVALLTYRSADVDAGGHQSRVTLRSSLWVRTSVGWQMLSSGNTRTEGFVASSSSSYLRG